MERIRQSIYLGRKGLNSIEFEHEVLKVPLRVGEETSFEMFIINHGEPTHVHFSLGEEIKDKVMVLQDKAYVIDEEKIAAIVKLPKSYAGAVAELGTGEIFVSAGYGATKNSFSVEIVEAKKKEKEKENGKGKEKRKEKEGERELEEVVRKEKKEFKVSPEERVFLMRLAVSAVAAIFFFVLLLFIIYFPPSSSIYLFTSALIASFLFIFIVIYNF